MIYSRIHLILKFQSGQSGGRNDSQAAMLVQYQFTIGNFPLPLLS